MENLPLGLRAGKAFGGLLKIREKARLAFERERARDRFSKLSNAVTRPPVKVFTGQLVMLWRQKMKPGRTGGSWIGPLRVVLVEGSTIWMATGSTLVRAKANQIRPVTKREELTASLEGTAVHRTPITTETLMRAFQGRYYYDMSGNVPSEQQVLQDLSPTEVQVQPRPEALRADTWELREDKDIKTLVRIHHLPRLALFSPHRVQTCPESLDELTGKRTTVVRPLIGGDEVKIHDEMDVQKTLQDRWTGETV